MGEVSKICRGGREVISLKPDSTPITTSQVEGLINLVKQDSGERIQNLEYIFDMLKEMRVIAKNINEASLVYYLEMAAMEAGDARDVLNFERDG